MKTRQLSVARRIACGLTLLGSISVVGGVTVGCDARVDALGSSAMDLTSRYANPDVCPDAPTEAMTNANVFADIEKRAPCDDVPAGTQCAYDVRNSDGAYTGWAAYVCGCSVENNWMNVGTANSGYACPDLAPIAGAPCQPLPSNETCTYYPDQFAACLNGAWRVETGPRYPCDLLGVIAP